MLLILGLLSILMAAVSVFTVLVIRSAPEGFEDESGFHSPSNTDSVDHGERVRAAAGFGVEHTSA